MLLFQVCPLLATGSALSVPDALTFFQPPRGLCPHSASQNKQTLLCLTPGASQRMLQLKLLVFTCCLWLQAPSPAGPSPVFTECPPTLCPSAVPFLGTGTLSLVRPLPYPSKFSMTGASLQKPVGFTLCSNRALLTEFLQACELEGPECSHLLTATQSSKKQSRAANCHTRKVKALLHDPYTFQRCKFYFPDHINTNPLRVKHHTGVREDILSG